MEPIDGGAILDWKIGSNLTAYIEISDASIAYAIQRNGREVTGGAGPALCLETIVNALQAIHSQSLDE
jgi:hypothetical protein